MNFPGPFNANLSSASAVSLDDEQFTFGSHSQSGAAHGGANGIVVPDKHLLFTGDYAREGNDLILSAPNQKYVVHDYFKGEKRPALISEDGAMLSGHIVSSLTGHVQYAQATAPDAAQVIGHVMKLTGSASVIRNGVTVELNVGDAVQKGDVVQTGSDSSIAMTLIDGSAFGMTSNARMVLNEMVYDPNGSSNSAFISLVQGTVTFVAGQSAKNGNMRVETPVATMGIRGTAVLTKIDLVLGTVEVSLGVEPDQHVGGLVFYDNATGALVGTMTQAGRVTVFSPSGIGQPLTVAEYQKSPDQVQSDKGLFGQVFQLAFPNYNPDDSKPKSTDHPHTDIGVPPTILGKNGTDSDTGRPSITYTIQSTNPDTHVTTTLNVVYINTAPSFAVTDVKDVQAIITGSHQFKLGDQVVITDPDINTAPFFDVATPYRANSGMLTGATTTSPAPGSYLLDMNLDLVSLDEATGVVTYKPEGFRFLGDGETAVYKFTFIASSGVGVSGSDSALLTLLLTITGENDAPVFALNNTPISFSENAHLTNDPTNHLYSSIQLAFTDEDFSDVASSFHLAKAVTTNVTGSHATTPDLTKLPDATTLLSYLTIDGTSGTGVTRTPLSNAGVVTAKFAAPDNVFDFLADGEQIQIVYTITIDDGHGTPTTPSMSTETITFTVTGTNDAPMLTADSGPHGITESDPLNLTTINTVSTLTVAGSLAFTDVDLTDTHSTTSPTATASVIWQKPDHSSGGTVPQATLNALATALTTSLSGDSVNGATGHVAWNFKLPDSLADFLAQDETLTVTYNVSVSDGHTSDSTATRPVTIVITGTNDAPFAVADSNLNTVVESGNNTDDTVFAGTPQATGFVLANDTDLDINDTHTVVGVAAGTHTSALSTGVGATIVGTYGSLVLNINGAWTYLLDNTNPATNALAQGALVTDVFSYTESDNHGAKSTTTLTVGITGTNDAPTTNVAPSAVTDVNQGPAITEQGVSPADTAFAGVATASGNVLANDSDVDTGDTKTVQGVGSGTASGPLTGNVTAVVAGTYGHVTIDAAGNWHYTLDNSNPNTDALKQGETVSDVFTYTMHDTAGATSSATLTIVVTGTNDAPVIANAASATLGSVKEDTTLSITGQLAATDVDHAATQTWSVQGATAGTYGSIGVDSATGLWTYTLANGTDGVAGAVQSLKAGESHDETFTVRVTDDQGAYVDQTVTVTVNGTNDAPVIANAAAATLGSVKEDTTLSITGQLSATDVDHAATQTWSVHGATAGTYGSIGVDSATGLWTYTLANGTDGVAGAVQSLKAGESHDETFTVRVTDDQGAYVDQTVTVTVNGTNDAPVIANAAAATLGSVKEDTTLSVTGQLAATDIDHDATQTWSVQGATAGTYGSIGVDSATGLWTYTLANGSAAVQALAAGEHHDETFTVRVTDDQGAYVDQTVTVTVNGTNDAPVIANAAAATLGSVKEDTTLSVTGQLAATDIDHDATQTWSVQGATAGTYGSIGVDSATGLWTYTLANGSAAVQALAAGEHHDETFTVRVTDDQGAYVDQTVTVTVNGTNDAPVINQNSQAASVSALGTTQVVGQFTETDPDAGDTHTWTIDGGSRFGAPDYHFAIDDFKVVKVIGGTPTVIYEDTFTGTAPPAPPTVNPNGQQYATSSRGFVNQSGEALIDSANASFVGLRLSAVNYGDPVVGQFATLLTDVSPGGTNGLRPTSTFAVQGLFDLTTPPLTAEGYGLRLSDRQNGGAATDQPGDDTVELAVVQDINGNASVQFSALDFVAGTFTVLQSIPVGTIAPDEQILLQLAHSVTTPGQITASYSLVHDGVTDPAIPFTAITSIFHGEDWTRAQFFGRAPAIASASPDADSILKGTYGTLDINQTGKWTYVLDSGLAATHALAANQTVHDVFTVRVADTANASDFKTVDITVTGANDAPAVTLNGGSPGTPQTVSYNENSGDVAIAPTATVSDIDSPDFNGGRLTVAITQGAYSENLLSIANEGTGPSEIGVSGNSVTYEGAVIGTLSGGANGSPIVVDFAASGVTQAAAQALIQHIQYTNISDNPSLTSWTIQFQLTDGDGTALGGQDTGIANATVTVTPIDETFTGPSGGAWSTAANWSEGHVPDSNETAYITNGLRAYAANLTLTGSAIYIDGSGSLAQFDNVTLLGGSLHGTDLLNSGANGAVEIISGGTGSVFDGTSSTVFIAPGTIVTIDEGAHLVLKGAVQDAGTIVVDPIAANSYLQIDGNVTLNGGGNVSLVDETHSIVTSATTIATLTIDNDGIVGKGHLGDGNLNIVNLEAGQIAANLSDGKIYIDTGAGTLTNAGLIISNGSGGLDIAGDIDNTGVGFSNGSFHGIEARAGLVEIHGNVTGHGAALIDGGTLQFDGVSDSHVAFTSTTADTLVLGDVLDFTGDISGMTSGDTISLGANAATTAQFNSDSVAFTYATGSQPSLIATNYSTVDNTVHTLASTSMDDVMIGGPGHDSFVFAPNSSHDTITNFVSGTDTVDLTALNITDTISAWFAAHVDTMSIAGESLVHLDVNSSAAGTAADLDTIRIKAVVTANDFILHTGTA